MALIWPASPPAAGTTFTNPEYGLKSVGCPVPGATTNGPSDDNLVNWSQILYEESFDSALSYPLPLDPVAGASTWSIVFTITSAGTVTSGGSASTWTIHFGPTSAGVVTHLGASTDTITFGTTSAGVRTRLGASTRSVVFGTTSTGFATHFGSSTRSIVFTPTSAGVRTRFGASILSVVFGFTSSATRTTFGGANFSLHFIVTSDGTVTQGVLTLPGSVTIGHLARGDGPALAREHDGYSTNILTGRHG